MSHNTPTYYFTIADGGCKHFWTIESSTAHSGAPLLVIQMYLNRANVSKVLCSPFVFFNNIITIRTSQSQLSSEIRMFCLNSEKKRALNKLQTTSTVVCEIRKNECAINYNKQQVQSQSLLNTIDINNYM